MRAPRVARARPRRSSTSISFDGLRKTGSNETVSRNFKIVQRECEREISNMANAIGFDKKGPSVSGWGFIANLKFEIVGEWRLQRGRVDGAFLLLRQRAGRIPS